MFIIVVSYTDRYTLRPVLTNNTNGLKGFTMKVQRYYFFLKTTLLSVFFFGVAVFNAFLRCRGNQQGVETPCWFRASLAKNR
jgi:hypothetical protein